ncbi:glycosyltransferase family 2 protein [Clostridium perfringens]|uniref:glycosyltransferase family 2 protein n=1 Tax=Clostridium perfringens TaxID=1502 RepID=UPI002ACE4E03|nr:glycosyltransferase [Clostridium perfringens]MDZ7546000.1 glycosyltransferase [Clostridium perfringens]
MPKVSFIVAVYNTENYLEKCLESIRNQTLENIEVIIVNDGSTDNSDKIIDKFIKKDKRFKVINKENGGLSSARNLGVSETTGEFIIFIDSDDFISVDMAEVMYNSCKVNNADMCICGIRYVYSNGDEINEKFVPINNVVSNIEGLKLLFMSAGFKCHAVNKMVKKELVRNIKFKEGILFEDVATTYKFILESKKISLIENKLYNYLQQRQGSILNSTFDERKLYLIDILKDIKTDLKFKKCFNKIKLEYNVFFADNIISLVSNYIKTSSCNNKKFLSTIKNSLKEVNSIEYLLRKNSLIEFLKLIILKLNIKVYIFLFRKTRNLLR